ncbi:MAG: hypothetical protein L0Z46_12920 [Nitrospiraceae bacterium]|nr:hypothetical protein [Nitrospiraceae bacterium]
MQRSGEKKARRKRNAPASLAAGTKVHSAAPPPDRQDAEWADSVRRLVDIGVREQNIWLYRRVAMALRRLPHEVLAGVANNMAENHSSERDT